MSFEVRLCWSCICLLGGTWNKLTCLTMTLSCVLIVDPQFHFFTGTWQNILTVHRVLFNTKYEVYFYSMHSLAATVTLTAQQYTVVKSGTASITAIVDIIQTK